MGRTIFWLLLLLACLAPISAFAIEIAPFAVRNQSPLVHIFGLPAGDGPRLPAPGENETFLTFDIASHSSEETRGREQILLDGETYRLALRLRHAVGDNWAVGIEIPYLWQRGGFLDSFIEGWHDTFGLPQGGRDEAPRDRLLFGYAEDGVVRLRLDRGAEGFGDLRLTGARRLLATETAALAAHAALKLPTGDSDELLGSGSTDLALWLAGDRALNAKVTLFGGAGALFLTDGDILPARQRHLAGFAQLGAGWRPLAPLVLKIQLDGHTPLYDSDLPQLGESLQLTLGGTLAWGNTALDIGVGEDLIVDSAPDVVFHLALRHRR